MATYDLTVGGPVGISNLDHVMNFVARIPIVVTDIIAGNSTLTANAAIAAGDIIKIWDIPANVVLLPGAVLETKVAGQAGNTLDVGLAGGQEYFAGAALDAAVGTLLMQALGTTWAGDQLNGVTFTATDTLDVQFIAEATSGTHVLHVPGYVIK